MKHPSGKVHDSKIGKTPFRNLIKYHIKPGPATIMWNRRALHTQNLAYCYRVNPQPRIELKIN